MTVRKIRKLKVLTVNLMLWCVGVAVLLVVFRLKAWLVMDGLLGATALGSWLALSLCELDLEEQALHDELNKDS